MIKILIKLFMALTLFIVPFGVCADTVRFEYEGNVNPNQLVSFMITEADANLDNLKTENIYRVEVVEADNKGYFSYNTDLENAVLDDDGKIVNYKLKSNVKGIDINSGLEIYDVTISDIKIQNDTVYVPIVSSFEKLGITLSYDEAKRTYTGEGNNGEIIIVMGEDTVEIDWVDVLMSAPSVMIDGVDMIPMDILCDAAKTYVLYDLKSGCVLAKKPDPFDKEEEFDIAEAVKDLPTGTEVLNQRTLKSDIYEGDGGEYLDISRGNLFNGYLLTLATDYNDYGEISSKIQAICNIIDYTHSKGEVGLVEFEARATRIDDESGIARVMVILESSSDYVKALGEQVNVSSDWEKYYLPVYNGLYSIGPNLRLIFDLGGQNAQTVEIRGFSFKSYGTEVDIESLCPPDTQGYKGIEEDHIWRKEAYRRIERYRKEDMTITVTDQNGNPIEGARLEVDMTNNEFMFGVALCDNEVVDLDTSTLAGSTLDSFIDNDVNTGVCGLEMKMGYILDDGGVDGVKAANEFLGRGKRMRGHALYWDETRASGLDDFENLTYDEIYRRVMDHIRPTAYAYKGRLEQWDVINEPHDSSHTRYNFNTTRLYSDIFKEVKKIDPTVKLYVNETGIEGKNNKNQSDRIPRFLDIVKRIQKEGGEVDGIGIQAHCQSYLYPQGFYHQLDECSQIVDEVAVTEYDFINENMDYADKHLRDTLLATFSHPKSTAFIVWGIEDSMHWRGEGPFYNNDWSEKPALGVWRSMVNDEFATHEKLTTDTDGSVFLRAFRGDYKVKCTINGVTYTADFKLTKDSANTINFVLDGNTLNADVSNAPYVNTEPLKFSSVDEARIEYEELNPVTYTGILIDANFKGCETITAVTNGADFSSDESFLKGEKWATSDGSKNLLAGGDSLSTILQSSGVSATVDLRRHIREAYRDEKTDVYFETMFDTMNSGVSGTMDVSLMVGGINTGASIVYSNGSYCINIGTDKVMELSAESEYTLRIVYSGNSARYELYKKGVLEDVYTSSTTLEANKAEEIGYYIVSDITAVTSIFKLYNARFCAYKDDELIRFTSSDLNLYEVDDTMTNFDISDDGLWKLTGDEDAFSYATYGKYLYAVRNSGTASLIRNFKKAEENETLIFSYGLYLNADYKWFSSTASAEVCLTNADGSVNVVVSEFKGDLYNGYELNLLKYGDNVGISSKVENGKVNMWNWRDLTIKLVLLPNDDGIYDIEVYVYDADNNLVDYSILLSILTCEEVTSLENIVIKTTTSGTSNEGQKICGFKNIRLEKSGRSLETLDDGKMLIKGTDKFGIKYDNSFTYGTHEADLFIAAYKGDSMLWAKEIPTVIDKENGTINFELDTADEDIDYLKIFLFKGNTIVPYKAADKIYVAKK